MLRTLIFSVFLLSSIISMAQIELTWDQLADVQYDRKWSEELDAYFWFPEFEEEMKALEGTQVKITGYLIPFDETNGSYVLSAFPFAACFFCGNAGPESVVGLQLLKEGPKFQTDDFITFKGTLHLNDNNVYEMNYNLIDAVLIDE